MSLFYVHSIVLGLVLNEYSDGFKTELSKKKENREGAIGRSYDVLKREGRRNRGKCDSYVRREDLKEVRIG